MAEQKSLPVASGLTAPARKKLVFAHDSNHGRIAKTVYECKTVEGTLRWALTKCVRFVHDGWQMIAELDHTSATGTGLVGSEVDRTYLWGPDLSGSMTGAGGVGGLLRTAYQGVTYQACSDANGNITGLVLVSDTGAGTLVARFDDDPFGNRVTNAGPSVELCPFGFSSKYLDTETGVVSYELRGYLPGLGRWMSRDLIGERGGISLYGMAGNDPVNRWDYLGLADISIQLQRNTRDLFGTYGQLTVSIDNTKLKKKMQKGEGCCRATSVGPYLTIELPPKAQNPVYTKGGSYGEPPYQYDRFYTGLFTNSSASGYLKKDASTSVANLVGQPERFRPAGMTDDDWKDMISYGIAVGNGNIMIHMGLNSTWSGGCILIGTQYVAKNFMLGTARPNAVFQGVEPDVGEVYVTHFNEPDTSGAQVQLTQMLWCAQKTLGKKLSISFSRVGPAIPPQTNDPNKMIPPPGTNPSGQNNGGGRPSWWPF